MQGPPKVLMLMAGRLHRFVAREDVPEWCAECGHGTEAHDRLYCGVCNAVVAGVAA